MVSPARQPDLLTLFLDPDIPSLPALAQRADLPLPELLSRLLDPSFQAILEAVEALEHLRDRFLASRAIRIALASLANVARTATDPVEARRAATTLLRGPARSGPARPASPSRQSAPGAHRLPHAARAQSGPDVARAQSGPDAARVEPPSRISELMGEPIAASPHNAAPRSVASGESRVSHSPNGSTPPLARPIANQSASPSASPVASPSASPIARPIASPTPAAIDAPAISATDPITPDLQVAAAPGPLSGPAPSPGAAPTVVSHRAIAPRSQSPAAAIRAAAGVAAPFTPRDRLDSG